MSETTEVAIIGFKITREKSDEGTNYKISFSASDELTDEQVISFIPVLYEASQKEVLNPPKQNVCLRYSQRQD